MSAIRKMIWMGIIVLSLSLTNCAPRLIIQPSGDNRYIVKQGAQIVDPYGRGEQSTVWHVDFDGVLISKKNLDKIQAEADKYTAEHIEY